LPPEFLKLRPIAPKFRRGLGLLARFGASTPRAVALLFCRRLCPAASLSPFKTEDRPSYNVTADHWKWPANVRFGSGIGHSAGAHPRSGFVHRPIPDVRSSRQPSAFRPICPKLTNSRLGFFPDHRFFPDHLLTPSRPRPCRFQAKRSRHSGAFLGKWIRKHLGGGATAFCNQAGSSGVARNQPWKQGRSGGAAFV
jgi:hypothetical protein